MPESSPEAGSKRSRKFAYIGIAILVGIIVGGGASAIAVRMLPATEVVKEVKPAQQAETPHEQREAKAIETLAPIPEAQRAEPAEVTGSSVTGSQIPVLSAAEIRERYHLTRFIDKETNMLCYVPDADGSGARGPLSCVPRPTALVPPPGNW